MKYEELSDEAKVTAREWWKELEAQDWGSSRASDLYEDFAICCSHLGITIKQEGVKHVRGDRTWHSTEWGIYWSGFWSQGDGLVIDGTWQAEDVDLDALLTHANDDALTRICTEMTVLKLRWPQATATITTVSSGPGLGYLSLDTDSGFETSDGTPGWIGEEDTKALKRLIERACMWMYDQLEENYNYDTGDEAAEEAITANGYEFDEDGAFEGHAHA